MSLFQKTKFAHLPIAAGLSVLMLAACAGDDDEIFNPADNNDGDNGFTVTQVDRMGRAGINTAVTDPFFDSSDPADDAEHGRLTDQYNSITSQTASVNQFADRFEANLAIYDGLDRDCTNQLARDANNDPYSFLATTLANDQVFVNAASGTCTQYFGVELNALGVPNTGGDCGGRTPLYDTIDVTYSAVAVGAVSGVGDGVPSDPDPVTHSATAFPFLAAPISTP